MIDFKIGEIEYRITKNEEISNEGYSLFIFEELLNEWLSIGNYKTKDICLEIAMKIESRYQEMMKEQKGMKR